MDVATVPFTVVTYSEPHREVAEAVDVPVTPFEQLASLPPPSQPVQPSSERDGRAYASPAGDTSDTDSDSEFEGRERTADEQMALDLQRDELSRSGLSPADMAAGTLPALGSEEQELGRRMSRRLSDITYAKHKPRVNSMEFRAEDFMTDREVLAQRLYTYGLCERVVKGDGNCQFRAVADQLYRTPHAHFELRKAVVARLRRRPELYAEYVPEDFATYCRHMEKDGTWGDHVTLQVVADLFCVKIYVLTSFPGSDFIEISPSDGVVKSSRMLYVSFWAEVHYNSIYPASDPPRDLSKSKVLGSRRLHRLFHGKPAPV